MIFTKLVCSTFDQEEESSTDSNLGNKYNVNENNFQDITTQEAKLSAKALQTDVDMTSLEDHGNDVKNGYFCR